MHFTFWNWVSSFLSFENVFTTTFTMKSALFFTSALAALCQLTTAAVVGEAEGFAAGVTGGAGGEEVTPTTIEELISYLKDDEVSGLT